MTETEAVQLARAYFLGEGHSYGCAETTLIVLQQAYGLPNAMDPSPAMALNGGVAWRGGICGAISGAALAVGRLAAARSAGHQEAKRLARGLIGRMMDGFCAEFGAVNCRLLIGLDIATDEGHRQFIDSKLWHTLCMNQIEFVIRELVRLGDERTWNRCVAPDINP
jgi:C_GCAxxG_C_C family probable redox protein